MKRGLLILLALTGLVLTVHSQDKEPPKTIADSEFGLATGSVFDTLDPMQFKFDDTDPGDGLKMEAPYHGAPLLINHTLNDSLPILFKDNACIDCHEVETKEEGEATPIPESHFVDLRNTPDKVGTKVAGARYNCISCHVSTSDARLLVDNEFQK